MQFFLFLAKFWGISRQIKWSKHRQWLKKFEDACELLCDITSVKPCVNQPDFFEKLGFQDKIFSKDTILFIPSNVLGDFKADKVK